MVAFMAYFFTLYLQARVSELPWLIGAVAVGTVCTYVMSAYVLPDRPESVLRATIRALRARMAIVVDTTAEAVRTGHLDERRRRRMRARSIRLNETALLVQSQIEDEARPATLRGIRSEQLAPWLFDAELAIEWVATAGRRAALAATDIRPSTRAALTGALTELSRAIRIPEPDGLARAASQAQQLLDPGSGPTEVGLGAGAAEPGTAAVRRLALAISNAATATSRVRAIDFADAFTSAAAQTRRNIDALVAAIDGGHAPSIVSVTDQLDCAESLARRQVGEAEPAPGTRRFLTAVHALRQIDRAVVTTATNLGAGDRLQAPSPATS